MFLLFSYIIKATNGKPKRKISFNCQSDKEQKVEKPFGEATKLQPQSPNGFHLFHTSKAGDMNELPESNEESVEKFYDDDFVIPIYHCNQNKSLSNGYGAGYGVGYDDLTNDQVEMVTTTTATSTMVNNSSSSESNVKYKNCTYKKASIQPEDSIWRRINYS
jgi:hypothetical protein